MSWTIKSPQPVEIPAVYCLVMPVDHTVLYASELNAYPSTHHGDFNSFTYQQPENTPIIPIDIHMAINLRWIQPHEAANNMPYLTENIRAAVALVT